MTDRNLDYYLGLNYELVLRRVVEYDKPFWEATTKELDRMTFYGVGDTPQDAIKGFEEVKQDMFPYYLEQGLEIPEPRPTPRDLPSGRFVLRIPPRLHSALIDLGRESNQSLNTLIGNVLDRFAFAKSFNQANSPIRQGASSGDSLSDPQPWKAEGKGCVVTDIRGYTLGKKNEDVSNG